MTRRTKYKRRKKLIKPGLQLRLVAIFTGVALVGLLLQAQLLSQELAMLIAEDPGAPLTTSAIAPLVGRCILLSIGWVLPMSVAIGILSTFRLAGPIYRIETHLAAIERGEDPGECRLRQGDQLQDLCAQVNRSVAVLRGQGAASSDRADAA